MGIEDPRQRHPAAGELYDHQRVGQQRHAEAAVLLGNHHPEEAHLLHLLDDLLGVLVVVLHLVGDGDDLPLDELADGVHDHALVFGQLDDGHR